MNKSRLRSGQQVEQIFREGFGDHAERLFGGQFNYDTMEAIRDAIAAEYGDAAGDIAFHLADWNSDAGFIAALHLFPDRFSPDMIREGVRIFLSHAPSHVVEACRLTGDTDFVDFSP